MAAAAVALAPVRERKAQEAEKLIRTICLEIRPMTREAFAPYGEVLGERGSVEIDLDGGQPSVIAQTVEERAMNFDFLGRHKRTEQVFIPLGGTMSVIAVALSGASDENPDPQKMAAFLVDGTCAFKLHRGTWHTAAFPFADRATFMVVDRENTLDEDLDLRDLKTALGVVVEIKQ